MNVIDFIRESAIYMAADRPDIYDRETAASELSDGIEALRSVSDDGQIFSCLMFTSYLLTRLEDDGVEEFILTRKLASLILFPEDNECSVYSHTDKIELPSVLDDSDDL